MNRRLILGLLTAMAQGLSQPPVDKIWLEYLDWFRKVTGPMSDVRSAYREHLLHTGLSKQAVAERIGIIERLMRERRGEWQAAFFDKTYRSKTRRFNTQPNALLVETAVNLKPGTALDIHMGQGRNAVYLASQGWQVTGFDFSQEGIAAAREDARQAGVPLNAIVTRHEDFEFGIRRWDLIVMSYTWIPLEARWIERITRSLKPGGVIVFEHLMEQSGSENAAVWLPRPNELPRIFRGLRILRYEDVSARADWSWRPERIARLVAENSLAPEDAKQRE